MQSIANGKIKTIVKLISLYIKNWPSLSCLADSNPPLHTADGNRQHPHKHITLILN